MAIWAGGLMIPGVMTNLAPHARGLVLVLWLLQAPLGWAADAPAVDARHLVELGPGDSVSMEVYGQPDLRTTVSVADDGSISVPLIGRIKVAGLSSVDAAQRIETAMKDGQYLIDPHVTLTVMQSEGQRVSVLGEVRQPGRYAITSKTSVFDLLAQAGGVSNTSADVVYILRTDVNGVINRYPINLKGFADQGHALPTVTLQSGDSLYVPRAQQFYIYGEVSKPEMYPIEPGMTVIEAIIRAGGVTPRGSERRVEIKRAGKDGKYVIVQAKPSDLVQPDDVIRVKESIF